MARLHNARHRAFAPLALVALAMSPNAGALAQTPATRAITMDDLHAQACGKSQPKRSDVDRARKAAASLPKLDPVRDAALINERWGTLAAVVGEEFATKSRSLVYKIAWVPGLTGYAMDIQEISTWTKGEYLSRTEEFVWDGTKLITKTNQFGWSKPKASCVARYSDGAISYAREFPSGGIATLGVWRIVDGQIEAATPAGAPVRRDPGAWNTFLARYAPPPGSGSGSGDQSLGMIAGAVLGGVMTGGSSEGILAGARAFAPAGTSTEILDDAEADIARQRRQEQQDSANFQRRINAIVNRGAPQAPSQSQPQSTGRSGTDTAQNTQNTRLSDPAGSSAPQGQGQPAAKANACNDPFAPNSFPGCPVNYRFTWGFVGNVSNSMCFSVTRTTTLPQSYDRRAADPSITAFAHLAADKERFKAQCRSKAPKTAQWMGDVRIDHNIGDSDPEIGDYSGPEVIEIAM
jgi:hypothetical protein